MGSGNKLVTLTYFWFRWKFVIHGGIDGFSRLVVFLSLSSNNRADTVLKYFHEAVTNWGLPAGVR